MDDYDHKQLDEQGVSSTPAVVIQPEEFLELINQMKPDFALSFWDKPSLSWSGSIIKSELYKKVLPDVLRQRYGKIFDWPLLVEAMQTGKAVSFCDKNCFFYRIHAQQDTVCDATGVTLEQLVN